MKKETQTIINAKTEASQKTTLFKTYNYHNASPTSPDPQLENIIKAENQGTYKALSKAMGSEQRFVKTATILDNTSQSPAAVTYGSWSYYSVEENDRKKYYRLKAATNNEDTEKTPQLILDETDLKDNDFHPHVIDFHYNHPSGKIIAFTQIAKKRETYQISILKISEDGTITQTEKIFPAARSFVLEPTGRTIYYVSPDAKGRACKLTKHILFTEHQTVAVIDQTIYEEPCETNTVAIGMSRSGRFIQVASTSRTTTWMGLIDTKNHHHGITRIIPRQENARFSLEHLPLSSKDYVIIHLNYDGKSYVKIYNYHDFNNQNELSELTTSNRSVEITRIQVFEAGIFITVRSVKSQKILFLAASQIEKLLTMKLLPLELSSDSFYEVFSAELDEIISFEGNAEWSRASVRFVVNSLKAAPQYYTFDFSTLRLEKSPDKFVPLRNGDPLTPIKRELTVQSPDGTMIPLTLIELDSWTQEPRPFIIFVYGAYGISANIPYSPFITATLEQGIGFAIAHVRGGGERGPSWYKSGKGLNKAKSIEDLIACACYLKEMNIVSADGLGLQCSSAGAVTAGQAINTIPELFSAVIMAHPYLDPLGSLQDTSNPFRLRDMAEWGDPLASEEAFKIIKEYSPSENIRQDTSNYPAILIIAGRYDQKTPLSQSLQYVDQVREAGAPHILLWINDDEGHKGIPSIRQAFSRGLQGYAWLLDRLHRSTFQKKCKD